MFGRIRKWWSDQRDRAWAHDEAWAPFLPLSADGLNAFVAYARERVIAEHGPMQFNVLTVANSEEKYIQARIPGTSVDLSIGGDSAQIHNETEELFWSEHYDYVTPDELVDYLCKRIHELRG